jgi:hypothetical protein
VIEQKGPIIVLAALVAHPVVLADIPMEKGHARGVLQAPILRVQVLGLLSIANLVHQGRTALEERLCALFVRLVHTASHPS